jgi:bifunctional DNase/RNase
VSVVRCVVESVRIHDETKQHVVNLKAHDAFRFLPIWIGPDSAHSISAVLYSQKTERPSTHDLVTSAFAELGVEVSRVLVKGLLPSPEKSEQGVFLASVFLRQGEREVEIDCRPSDAIALAVRAGAPVEVDRDLFERSSVDPGS